MEYHVRVMCKGILVAETYITANGKEDFAYGLMEECRDAQNGDNDWLDWLDDEDGDEEE